MLKARLKDSQYGVSGGEIAEYSVFCTARGGPPAVWGLRYVDLPLGLRHRDAVVVDLAVEQALNLGGIA